VEAEAVIAASLERPLAQAFASFGPAVAAASILAEDPARTTVLAGGQSLLIELRYRTARPRVILDVNQVGGLDGLGVEDESLRIGALVRHAQLEHLDEPVVGRRLVFNTRFSGCPSRFCIYDNDPAAFDLICAARGG